MVLVYNNKSRRLHLKLHGVMVRLIHLALLDKALELKSNSRFTQAFKLANWINTLVNTKTV